MVDFDDLDDLDNAPVRSGPAQPAEQPPRTAPAEMKCGKCSGTGQTQWGVCYRCKGKGTVSHGYDARRAAYQKGEATKARNTAQAAVNNWNGFKFAMPSRAKWIEESAERGFQFAANMRTAVERFGALTVNQLATVDRLMGQDKERATQQAERSVEIHGAATIRAALVRANENGLKKPKLRCGAVRFDWPREGTKNPGCIYVVAVEADDYLGKITPAGVFEPSFKCTEAQRQMVLSIAMDPLAAAIEHGRTTGACACCGRPLSDPESVARGIGPICASKFFGA